MKLPKLSKKAKDPSKSSPVRAHIKGNLYALTLTFVCVLIFALLVQFVGMSSAMIGTIVQVIKVIAIFIGVLVVVKNVQKRAWLHGAILGLVYTVLAFLIFSIITPNFSITDGLLYECLFAIIVGSLSAMLLRLRKRNV